ncbi:MAG: glutamate--tRNA ligase [Gammaproteobacteria bacterium]
MVVTRFAPSPTGALHIGSVRTALFCWLLAKRTEGKFILRIEDTDRERSTQASVDNIIAGLKWLRMDWDEGPYYQTARFDRYHAVIEELMASGHAYRCECSKERLEALRDRQMAAKEKPRYDGACRHKNLPPDHSTPCVIRFQNPEVGTVKIEDLIRGTIEIANSELDDLIIARSDGTPTYNLTVVVDDWDMGVTHVLRGDDHINNTPRQINILKALNAHLPLYGHMPMILGPDGKRLSKRHGAVDVLQYETEGYLPEAMLNYLVRLGWSHGDQEIFSVDEMIALFDAHQINSSASSFNPDKLLWLNHHYIKTLPPEAFEAALRLQFELAGVDVTSGPSMQDVILAQRERCKTLKEMMEKSRFCFEEFAHYDQEAVQKFIDGEAKKVLTFLQTKFNLQTDWKIDSLHQLLQDVSAALDVKLGKIAQPLRIAITGGTISPPIDATLYLLGRERTLARLERALTEIA